MGGREGRTGGRWGRRDDGRGRHEAGGAVQGPRRRAAPGSGRAREDRRDRVRGCPGGLTLQAIGPARVPSGPAGGPLTLTYTAPMSVRPILLLGDPRLRLKGLPVDGFGKYLHELLDDLGHTMRAAPGVGLAAPQLGAAVNACVVEIEGQLHELVNPHIVRATGDDRAP